MSRTVGSKNKPKKDEHGNIIKATRSPRGTRKAAAAPKPKIPRVPGMEPALDIQYRPLLMQTVKTISGLRAKIADETSTLRNVYKSAATSGISKSDINFALQLQKSDSEAARALAERRARIIEWIYPVKPAMKPAESSGLHTITPDDAYSEGKTAGRNGINEPSTYEPGSEHARAWEAGWKKGSAERNSPKVAKPWMNPEVMKDGDDASDPFEGF